MNKTEDEASNLIEELKLDAISVLSSTVDARSQKLEHLNVNSVSSSTPSPSCDICGSIDHLTVHYQVGSPFAQDVSDRVNYVNNYHPRLTNDPFSNTYNLGWRNHPISLIF